MFRSRHIIACCLWFFATLSSAAAGERPITDPPAPEGPKIVCAAVNGRLPATVLVQRELQPVVQRMLERSAFFRHQCQLLAEQSKVYVRVQIATYGMLPSQRARAQVQRTAAGPLIVWVQLAPAVNWSEWIGHEFEHILEQVEGLRLRDLRDGHDSWESDDDTYESARAINAGRVVREQVRQKPVSLATED